MAIKRKKPHIILVLVVIILIIPLVVLGTILFSSLEDSSQPVVAHRFEDELNPKITEEQLASVKSALNYDNVDSIEVNSISATVRVMLNVKDDMSAEDINWMVNDAYSKIDGILPIATYFTNTETTKMYDLEINVYNVTSGENKIYYCISKTGGAETYTLDVLSTPKNQEVTNDILNPQPEEQTEEPNTDIAQ